MSESKSLITAMNVDVEVGMNEVVSVFVSKYEDGLFAKKEDLSKRIKAAKEGMAQMTKALENSVSRSQYECIMPIVDLTTRVVSVEVNWTDSYQTKKNTITVTVGVYDKDETKNRTRHFTKTFTFNISSANVNTYNYLTKELEGLNAELIDVMGLIKSVSRKERQIRGRLSEMKLEQSGFSDLLNNPEMLKLVEFK